MDKWSAFAELPGMVSSVLLLIPAIALNKHLREVRDSESALAKTTTGLFQAIASAARPTLVDARIPEWSARDQKLLVLGIVTFGLSCLIKFGVILVAPAPGVLGAGLSSTGAASAGAASVSASAVPR